MKVMIIGSLLLLFQTTLWAQEESASLINWLSFEEAVAEHAKEERKLLVAIYTDHCALCKRLEETSFQDSTLAAYINEHFYPVKFNAESQEDLQFGDQTFKFIRSGNIGYHEFAAELLKGRLSFPSLVFLNEKLEQLQSISGLKSTLHLQQITVYFGDNHYKTTPWSTFQKKFASTDR